MPRKYRYIKEYEQEIVELKKQGKTNQEISGKFGFTVKQIKNLLYRNKVNQEKLSEGIALKRPGRPSQNVDSLPPSIQQLSKLTQLQYEIASKDRYIKRLEMENELMRDFLSLTERK